MKNNYWIALLISLAATGTGAVTAQMSKNQLVENSPAEIQAANYLKEGYKLVWADEFNEKGKPDPANWKYEHGYVRNEEVQWYQPENAWCENGTLIIEGRKEQKPNPRFKEGSTHWPSKFEHIEYTSSSINTRGNHKWQYGRFVMRGKIDASMGLWPAWWTLGVSGEWPTNGEIDIMEFYRGKILANIATGSTQRYKAKWHSKTKPVSAMGGKDWSSKFHIWRMDWTEKDIALFVDDELLIKVPLEKLDNAKGGDVHPFKQPHYMLLNLAMGGLNGGDVNLASFPNRFEVDYVRVYQK